jgi:hypothetical protein
MTTANEKEIEKEIQAKGLNAPRLQPYMIDATIVSEAYHVFPGSQMTVCALTLRNGFVVTGESACASPENFDAAIGKRIARDNARGKIWALEGYRLKSRLSTGVAEGAVEGIARIAHEVNRAYGKMLRCGSATALWSR